ncbi:MAG: FprA family A-type flavoprotein [Clostridia bacterium]|nr:FprA family A-type flavoprotein [Clostridia bacterium]
MNITDNIKYIGVNDHTTDLFEGQYKIPDGISYNSYIIFDEKIAVFDTVDIGFTEKWLENLKKATSRVDYLIISHMEPDHSASILAFLKEFPQAKLVGNQKTFNMLKAFFNFDFSENSIVVNEGDKLSLGNHVLNFYFAPMVHWPEVMVTYEQAEEVLFSADAFGRFGALDVPMSWACEARRYYFGIVGKYGMQVQALLKKLKGPRVSIICPLHGPVINSDLNYYLNLYNIWSSYKPEKKGVCICYTSVYGNTKKAVLTLKKMLEGKGKTVAFFDLSRDDIHEAVEDAFKYDTLVLATTTYNGDIFPHMKEFINHLTERNYQNRRIGFIENGSWAPMATKIMKKMLENGKNLEIIDTGVTILSALNDNSYEQIKALANEL